MKLHVLSDLHNEFSLHMPSAITNSAEVIILAGDIWKQDRGIYWARDTWPNKEIIYVAGNHEFYGRNRKDVISQLHIAAKNTGVHFLDDDEVVIDSVRFIGATLWTDFELLGDKEGSMIDGQMSLNDFRAIREGDWIFSPTDSINLHNISISFINSRLAEAHHGKTVVVTHHLPSMLSVAERFKEGTLSACFASNLDHMFGKSELWIHGHTHDSFDYVSNGTRVVCNPRGYCRYDCGQENGNFDPNLIIEI